MNIFPNCQTLFHYLVENPLQLQKVFERLNSLYKETRERLEVPFIKNLDGFTPLHLLMQKNDSKTINFLLLELKNYGFDHHSRYIANIWDGIIK